MLYITGDTHGKIENIENREKEYGFAAGDVVIVCGDFGFLMFDEDRERENAVLDLLEEKSYTICFCDGNHENFPAIYAYPVEMWNGGRVHRIRKNVLHLMRGEIFGIDGKNIFAMGGGITYNRDCKRGEGIDYWYEELPCKAEYDNAVENLARHGNSVDIIVSHTAPTKYVKMLTTVDHSGEGELMSFFDWIEENVSFGQWYFGHMHQMKQVGEKLRILYHDCVKITPTSVI